MATASLANPLIAPRWLPFSWLFGWRTRAPQAKHHVVIVVERPDAVRYVYAGDPDCEVTYVSATDLDAPVSVAGFLSSLRRGEHTVSAYPLEDFAHWTQLPRLR